MNISIEVEEIDAAENVAQQRLDEALKQQASANEFVNSASKELEDIRTTKRVITSLAAKSATVRKAFNDIVHSMNERSALPADKKRASRYAPLGNNKRLVFKELRERVNDFLSVSELSLFTGLKPNQINSVLQDAKERKEIVPNGMGAGTRYKILPKGLQRLSEDEMNIRGDNIAA